MRKKIGFIVMTMALLLCSCTKQAPEQKVDGTEQAANTANEAKQFDEINSPVFYATENVKLRVSGALTADEITVLPKGSRVKILEVGTASTIDEIYAFWKKVCSEDNQVGWCFSAYLSNTESTESVASERQWGSWNVPTSFDYVVDGFKYKTLVAFKCWKKAGIAAKVKEAALGDGAGHSYTMSDVGRKELLLAVMLDHDQNVLLYDDFTPYDLDEYHFKVNTFNSAGTLVATKQFLPKKDIEIFSEQFFTELEKAKQGEAYKNSSDTWHHLEYNRLRTYRNACDKKHAGQSIEAQKVEGYYMVSYNDDGYLVHIVPKEKHANNFVDDSIEFFDAVYRDGKLIEAKYKDNVEAEKYLHYVFTKYDSNGNWLEADVFKNNESEAQYSIIRSIGYY